MRRIRVRAAFVAVLTVAVMLAAVASISAAGVDTQTNRSIVAADNSLTIDVVSTGNAGAIHGNATYWTSPVDASGAFEWFNQDVSVTNFAFPDTGNNPVFSAAMVARNIGAGYGPYTAFVDPFNASLEGVYSVSATGTDDFGDISGAITPAFGIDKTDPVVSTDVLPFYAGTPTVTLTATDTLSGMENVLLTADLTKSYSVEPDPLDPGNFTHAMTFSGEGMHMCKWVAFDNAGNASAGSLMFTIDNTAPSTTSNAVALYNGPAKIKLTGNDGVGGSGVAHTYYVLDGNPQAEGTTVNVPAPVNGFADHTLEFWSVDAVGNPEAPHQFVNFRVNSRHWITQTVPAHGSISPAGIKVVNLGANSTTYTFLPAVGYHIQQVYVDGIAVGRPLTYTFTNVTANHHLSVLFAIDTFTINPSRTNTNGTITPGTLQRVNYGANSPVFRFVPKAGYKVSALYIDGKAVPVRSSYQFTNVKASHTIRVAFALK